MLWLSNTFTTERNQQVIAIYQVVDDREGLNTVLATYDNETSAEAHCSALAAQDKEYGEYFSVVSHLVMSQFRISTAPNA